jgi:hypothetical protein
VSSTQAKEHQHQHQPRREPTPMDRTRRSSTPLELLLVMERNYIDIGHHYSSPRVGGGLQLGHRKKTFNFLNNHSIFSKKPLSFRYMINAEEREREREEWLVLFAEWRHNTRGVHPASCSLHRRVVRFHPEHCTGAMPVASTTASMYTTRSGTQRPHRLPMP